MKISQGVNYGIFAMSLGYINIPMYLYLPKFYAENFGVSLFWLSFLLFFCRIIDTLQDPFIGWLSDRMVSKNIRRSRIIAASFPFLALALYCLLMPSTTINIYLWGGVFMVLAYTAYSFISVNYYTMAAGITEEYNEQTMLVSFREAFALIGISLGSIVPSILLNRGTVEQAHFFSWSLFVIIGLLGLAVFLIKRPPASFRISSYENIFQAAKGLFEEKKIVLLIIVSLTANVAASLPVATVLFYIQDVLDVQAYFGAFLGLYFMCGLVCFPVWYYLSKHTSKKFSWIVATIITIIGFFAAGFLRQGDGAYYAVICIVTGMCLGGDIAMPISILSDLIAHHPSKGKYYGVWGLVSKASIAVAGSFGLFVLGWLGYQPGVNITDSDRLYVAVMYAFVPCGIKLVSLFLLLRWDIESERGVRIEQSK